MILAGGLGTRLRPLTDKIPKPMVPVNGRPFLEYLVTLLKENGIEEIVMLLGYKAEKIIEHFGDGSGFGIKIKYSVGDASYDTGKRLKNGRDLFDEHFLLMYSDNYWPLNLAKMAELYRKTNASVVMTAYNNKYGAGEYGYKNNLCISDSGLVNKYSLDYIEDNFDYSCIDVGSFVVAKNIIDKIPDRNISFQRDFLPKLISQKTVYAYRTDYPYVSITNIDKLKHAEKLLQPKKIVFLDRDGVINKKMPLHDYVKIWKEFKFLPGSIEAIKLLNNSGYEVYVVSNQQGVAKGVMSKKDLDKIHQNMSGELKKNRAEINAIYCCTHSQADGCDCRKPKPGLFFRAARDYNLDLTKTFFIGDRGSDLEAGKSAGCKTFLVSEGNSLLNIIRKEILKTA